MATLTNCWVKWLHIIYSNFNLLHKWKYHCAADRLFGLFIAKQVNMLFIQHKQSSGIQTNKTGGQRYSDTSLYKLIEYSLATSSLLTAVVYVTFGRLHIRCRDSKISPKQVIATFVLTLLLYPSLLFSRSLHEEADELHYLPADG